MSTYSPLVNLAKILTPLAANASAQTSAIDVSEYKTLCGIVFADQAGTAVVQQSDDAVNWDAATSNAFVVNTGLAYSVPRVARFARLVVTNGSATVAQTALRASFNGSTR